MVSPWRRDGAAFYRTNSSSLEVAPTFNLRCVNLEAGDEPIATEDAVLVVVDMLEAPSRGRGRREFIRCECALGASIEFGEHLVSELIWLIPVVRRPGRAPGCTLKTLGAGSPRALRGVTTFGNSVGSKRRGMRG